MRDNDYRRQQGYGRDYDDNDYQRQGRDSDNWGSNRQQGGGYEGRGGGGGSRYGAYSQTSQSDFDRYSGQGRSQDYGSDYGSGRSGGPGGSGSEYGGYGGGYGGGNRYQDDRASYGRQQDAFNYGGGQQRGYNDRFTDDYGSRQRGEQYGGRGEGGQGGGQGRYGEGFYGDASRFGSGMQQGNRDSQQHHDPDYHQWRSEQLRNLDSDYEAWRGERYKKFSDDFNDWRSKRTSQDQNQAKQQGSGTTKTKDQS